MIELFQYFLFCLPIEVFGTSSLRTHFYLALLGFLKSQLCLVHLEWIIYPNVASYCPNPFDIFTAAYYNDMTLVSSFETSMCIKLNTYSNFQDLFIRN